MKLKCAIIDDEPLAIDLLRSYVGQTPFLELAGAFDNAMAAAGMIRGEGIQVLFLDINMPQINGLEFSKTLPDSVKVIFTTAYDQYAVESFRLNALDYLLKPISYGEFLEASNRALDWFTLVDADRSSGLFVKSGHRMEKIDLKDILYIENRKDYVLFHTEGAAPVSSLMSMNSLEERLSPQRFMRVHRSFIVNLDKVKTVERNCIVFGKEYIPVSDSYKDKFGAFLSKMI